ncbi:MAG: IS66 family insertion sequence element accessory protein TnpB [Clostridia bacterium]|nr:IS66 family insertion sequence element accessory protein TnpB [Clostridia bacterium]
MLNDAIAERVYLACGSTDLRKSIDGLAALVKEGFELDPFSPCLFAFCNSQRDKIKYE